MTSEKQTHNVIEKTRILKESNSLTVGEVLSCYGTQSYGVLILVLAVLIVLPTGIIPGIALASSLLIVFFLVQYVIGMKNIYLPKWLKRKKLPTRLFASLYDYMAKYEKSIDSLVEFNHLTLLFKRPYSYLTTGLLTVTALSTIPLTLLPFFEMIPGIIMAFFALAFIVFDGRVIIYCWLASSLYLASFALIVYFTQASLF